MPGKHAEEKIRYLLQQAEITAAEEAPEEQAPARLKARLYSALVREQQSSGPLQDLDATFAAGHQLCVFEKLVQIAPVGERVKQPFYCRVCHARLLAEKMENAPIFWAHCPYAEFQKS